MRSIWRFLFLIPVCFTLLVGWLSWNSYRTAPQVAEENLRGAALAIASAIEQIAAVPPFFSTLSRYNNPDVAYFSLLDEYGVVRFHTNPALIGIISSEKDQSGNKHDSFVERRKILGTGEEIYQLQSVLHVGGNDYTLLLNMHTYRADAVIRRARTGVGTVLFLTMSLWGGTIAIFFLLRRAELQQRTLQRREELARLGELGAVMAHEIRNPLAGIKGFAQLVETAADLTQARLYAETIVSQSLRMENLVNDLLSYSREDRGERQATDLGVLLRDCVTLIRMESGQHTVDMNYPQCDGIRIMAASDRLIQLFLNLMKNALQAMPDGGMLAIELVTVRSSAIITIRDSGIGIPEENLEKIFDPFWTSKAKGTGLGLALCKKIAEEHGGTVTVESVVGVGTTFTVTLALEG